MEPPYRDSLFQVRTVEPVRVRPLARRVPVPDDVEAVQLAAELWERPAAEGESWLARFAGLLVDAYVDRHPEAGPVLPLDLPGLRRQVHAELRWCLVGDVAGPGVDQPVALARRYVEAGRALLPRGVDSVHLAGVTSAARVAFAALWADPAFQAAAHELCEVNAHRVRRLFAVRVRDLRAQVLEADAEARSALGTKLMVLMLSRSVEQYRRSRTLARMLPPPVVPDGLGESDDEAGKVWARAQVSGRRFRTPVAPVGPAGSGPSFEVAVAVIVPLLDDVLPLVTQWVDVGLRDAQSVQWSEQCRALATEGPQPWLDFARRALERLRHHDARLAARLEAETAERVAERFGALVEVLDDHDAAIARLRAWGVELFHAEWEARHYEPLLVAFAEAVRDALGEHWVDAEGAPSGAPLLSTPVPLRTARAFAGAAVEEMTRPAPEKQRRFSYPRWQR